MFSSIVPGIIILFYLVRWIGSKTETRGSGTGSGQNSAWTQPIRGTWHMVGIVLFLIPLVLTATALFGYWLSIADAGLKVLVFFVLLGLSLVLPHWLAWRVLGPHGFDRLGYLAVILAPRLAERHHVGSVEVYAAAFGLTSQPSRWWGDAWSLFALALRARNEGADERLQMVIELIDRLPGRKIPRRLRTQGWEMLAWSSIERGRWDEALDLLRGQPGRGAWFLRSVVRHRRQGSVPGVSIWWLWMIGPYRKRSLRTVRALRSGVLCDGPSGEVPEREGVPEPELVGVRHLGLLMRAGSGQGVEASSVLGLAQEWDRVFGEKQHLDWVRRGLELKAPSPRVAMELVVAELRQDLEWLGQVAKAPWPPSIGGGGFVGHLERHRADHFLDTLDRLSEPWRGGAEQERRLEPSLLELEEWLALRVVVRGLWRTAGEDELAAVWYDSLRYAACNWPVSLIRRRSDATTLWVCREMYEWCLSLAERFDDEEIAELTRGNLENLG